MLPDGLAYIDSWVADGSLDRCFQLMETDDPALFGVWTGRWRDLVEFEVIPVVRSAEAALTDGVLAGTNRRWSRSRGFWADARRRGAPVCPVPPQPDNLRM